LAGLSRSLRECRLPHHRHRACLRRPGYDEHSRSYSERGGGQKAHPRSLPQMPNTHNRQKVERGPRRHPELGSGSSYEPRTGRRPGP
jgi:hypothetical protein